MEFKNPRDIWPSEPSDFTPWLLKNPDYLAESLGIDLELDRNEHPVGPFSLDLFGSDLTHECPLIVENQLEQTDHSHLGQLLTYAAGTDAKTVVWISTEFRDEHRQALEYLNNLAGDATRFFGIEIKVAVIANSPPAAILNVVVQPSDWRAQVSAERASTAETSINAAYRSFWSQYLERINEEHPDVTKTRSAQGANWIHLNYPRKGIYINAAFIMGKKMSCELYIDVGNPERNMAIFDALEDQKTEIEKELGAPLVWQPLEKKRACRLRLERDGSIKDDTTWPELIEWLLEWHVALKKVLVPFVKELDESYWTGPLDSE